MKRFLKPILFGAAGLLIVGILVTAVVFFLPRDNTSFSYECFRLRYAVSDFLKDVKSQRLEDAFDRVYPQSESGACLEKTEELRNLWVGRVSDLKQKENTYLADFSDLKVTKKNGEFTVTVTLSVIRQGYNDPFYATGNVILVVDKNGTWNVAGISGEDVSLQTPFEQALSGVFAED